MISAASDTETMAQALRERGEYHVRSARRYARFYQRMGALVAIMIPLLSAIVTFLSALHASMLAVSIMSFIVTVLAVVQSAFRPADKYVYLSKIQILIHDWRLSLDRGYHERLGEDEHHVSAFLLEKNKEMSRIGWAMAENTLPGTARDLDKLEAP